MRNYSEASVATTVAFSSPSYNVALEWARAEQKAAPANVSYSIDQDGNGGGIVNKHEGFNGGIPLYQPIVHK